MECNIVQAIKAFIMVAPLIWAIREFFLRKRLEQEIEAHCLNVSLGEYTNDCERKVVLKNKSQGLFKDIFVVLVENKDVTYVNKKSNKHIIKNSRPIKSLEASIRNGFYSYVETIIDEEDAIIHTGGPGGNKVNGVVLLFTAPSGEEWIEDTNNKLYRIEGKKELLKEIGLQDPGYEHPVKQYD